MAADSQLTPSVAVLPRKRPEVLRGQVIAELQDAGFVYQESDGLLALPDTGMDPKELARQLHAEHLRGVLEKNARFIDQWEDKILDEFAHGSEVEPGKIAPRIVPVQTPREAALFRFASLHWSVPVSVGYGRRTRFLVYDDHNDKLMGIFALGDPVFNLAVRDRLVGWSVADRRARLYNVFDAYVLGAMEPYRELIGGKMIAACAVANETAEALVAKYEGSTTVITKEKKDPRPVLITTTSSLGRSSTYNRITYGGRKLFAPIGYTEGFGHFHFSADLFDELLDFLRGEGFDVRGHQYGDGPNWRIRTIRKGLEALGLDGDLLRHGIRRQVFIAPRAMGWRAFLRGETRYLRWFDLELNELSQHWRDRWAVPRAGRDARYASHDRNSMRLTPRLERLGIDGR